MQSENPQLFMPLELRGLTLRNRIMVSPMCQYRSVNGGPVDWHLVHLGQFAIGGAGLVFHEETSVTFDGQKTYHCAGLYTDEHVAEYARINRFLHAEGACAAIQLGHAGRKASNAGAMHGWRPLDDSDRAAGTPPWQSISSSDLPNESGWPAPRAMTKAEIQNNIDAWALATRRSVEAGFDVLEIHGAHGYLIHQFLSPVANQRKDEYGGSRENRMRFALEITEAVRASWPDDKPLFFRASCVDGQGGIWNLEDTIALARELKNLGVDVLDCSSGGMAGETGMSLVPRVPGYHLEFSEHIKQQTGLPTIAVGLITEAAQAEAILRDGKADIIAMARELMLQPGWPVQAARALGLDDPWAVHPADYAFRLRRREEIAQLTIDAQGENPDPGLTRLVSAPRDV